MSTDTTMTDMMTAQQRRWIFKRAKRGSESAGGMSSSMIRESEKPTKKIPVLFFDEAHRLYASLTE